MFHIILAFIIGIVLGGFLIYWLYEDHLATRFQIRLEQAVREAEELQEKLNQKVREEISKRNVNEKSN